MSKTSRLAIIARLEEIKLKHHSHQLMKSNARLRKEMVQQNELELYKKEYLEMAVQHRDNADSSSRELENFRFFLKTLDNGLATQESAIKQLTFQNKDVTDQWLLVYKKHKALNLYVQKAFLKEKLEKMRKINVKEEQEIADKFLLYYPEK